MEFTPENYCALFFSLCVFTCAGVMAAPLFVQVFLI